jgi:hypothetical protein
MNPEHVVAVAVRLFAIGLTVYAITGAVGPRQFILLVNLN